MADSDPLVASSVRVFCARNSQREGRDHLIQCRMGISAGFFRETTGSLRNPETRRTPSYMEEQIHATSGIHYACRCSHGTKLPIIPRDYTLKPS